MVEIVSFSPAYAEAFKSLNFAWIQQLFEIEPIDEKVLGDPKKYIIDPGGAILVALLDDEPVGVCALLNKQDGVYELAKMAVSESARGNKIGLKLGQAIIEKAKELGAIQVILETNSILKPAIGLYKKLGFKDICGIESEYQRCNIQMEITP